MHMPDVNEGANSVDNQKKVFSQTEGEEFQVIEHDYCHKYKKLYSGEEECLAGSCSRAAEIGKKTFHSTHTTVTV